MSKQLKNWVKSSFCLSEECFSLKWKELLTQFWVKSSLHSILSHFHSKLSDFHSKLSENDWKTTQKWLNSHLNFESKWLKIELLLCQKLSSLIFSVIFTQNWVVLTHFWNFTRSSTINYWLYSRFSTLSDSVWAAPSSPSPASSKS